MYAVEAAGHSHKRWRLPRHAGDPDIPGLVRIPTISLSPTDWDDHGGTRAFWRKNAQIQV